MSFFKHGEIYPSDVERRQWRGATRAAPRLIFPISHQLVIPQRVAPQQGASALPAERDPD
jgi:hypothetical protein